MRHVPAAYLAGERELAQALTAADAAGVHDAMGRLGYLPEPEAFDAERLLVQLQEATEWWLEPGERALDPSYVAALAERSSSPRSPSYDLMGRQTIPPEALLLRRMEALLFAVLGELRASADWAALARELQGGEPAGTELGDAEAAWLTRQAPVPARR
jgi:hypothetical protein